MILEALHHSFVLPLVIQPWRKPYQEGKINTLYICRIFVKSKTLNLKFNILPFHCSIQNTVFLEVECPTIKPPVIILSDSGQNNIDFGDVCVGRSTKRVLLIQNVTDERVDVSFFLLLLFETKLYKTQHSPMKVSF